MTGDDGQDAISLAGVSAATFTSLTSVTASTGGGNDNYFGSAIGDTVNMGASDATSPGAPGDVVTPGSGNDHITCPGGCQVNENLTDTTTLTDAESSDPGGRGGVDSFSGVTSLQAQTSGTNVNVDASGATVPVLFDGFGNSSGQVFRGGSGNDSFNISAGSASIDGGGGSNSLMISPGSDGKVTLTPTSVAASVDATLQNIQSASITGGSGDNIYDWSTFTGPVVLSDTSGHDTVTGGAGNDSITLFGGEGSVNAGGGDDQIYLRGDPTANYSVNGGSGSNTLTWAESAAGTITATNSLLSTPDGPITLSNIGALTLDGTNGNDVFDARGFSGPVTIAGEGGQDVMLGGPGADSFTGFSDSTDCFNGGPGADTIDGGGSTSDTDVVDPADTLVSGSTYTPVSTCGYGDAAPIGSTTGGGGSGGGVDSTPPAASAQIAAWGTQFSSSTYGGSVTVIGFATDPSPSSGTPTVRCSLDPPAAPASYADLGSGACTQATTTVGSHTFYVAARDPAGNTSTVASVSFRIVAIPDTTITSGPTGNTWTTSPSYTFTSTIPGSTFSCRVDGAPPTACSSPRGIGPFAAGTTHTFSVQATSPAGVADLTPAVAVVHVNATQTIMSRDCDLTPFPYYYPEIPPGSLTACDFSFGASLPCLAHFRCLNAPDACPAAASCTLRVNASWVDGDTGVFWSIFAWADLADIYHNPGRCHVPDDNRACAAHDSEEYFGPASLDGVCDTTLGPIGTPGSPADRELKCTATLTITPAAPLGVIGIGGGIGIFAPGGGKLILAPGVGGAGGHAAHVAKKAAPVFKTTTINVASAREVRFVPKLSAAAKKSYKRHRNLAIAVRMTFVPASGGATFSRTIKTTLKPAPKRLPRCPARPPKHLKKPPVCRPK